MVRARPHIHRHKNPANWARLLHKSTAEARHSPLLGVSTTRDTFRPGPVSYPSRARLPIDNAGACWHYTSQAPLLPHWGATYQVVAPGGAFCGLEATRPLRVYYQGHRFLLYLSPLFTSCPGRQIKPPSPQAAYTPPPSDIWSPLPGGYAGLKNSRGLNIVGGL